MVLQLIKAHGLRLRQMEPLRHQAVVMTHFHLRIVTHMNGLQGLSFEQSQQTGAGQVICMNVVGVDVILRA